jgi:hypothetical protein
VRIAVMAGIDTSMAPNDFTFYVSDLYRSVTPSAREVKAFEKGKFRLAINKPSCECELR